MAIDLLLRITTLLLRIAKLVTSFTTVVTIVVIGSNELVTAYYYLLLRATVTTTCYGPLLHDTALPDQKRLLFQALEGHGRKIWTLNLDILKYSPP